MYYCTFTKTLLLLYCNQCKCVKQFFTTKPCSFWQQPGSCSAMNRKRFFLFSPWQPGFYRSPPNSSPADSRRSFSPSFTYPQPQQPQRPARPAIYQTYDLNGPRVSSPTAPKVRPPSSHACLACSCSGDAPLCPTSQRCLRCDQAVMQKHLVEDIVHFTFVYHFVLFSLHLFEVFY